MNDKKINSTRMTVAFNGDLELIPKLAKIKEVESIFGKLPKDVVGGGRETFTLADLDFDHLKKCIDKAHEHGLQFVYVMNASCMGNREHTRKFNEELDELLNNLSAAKVDWIVVATPYMLDLIKRRFPEIKVSISTFSHIDNQRKATNWEERGADRLILHPDLTRNFPLLQKIRDAVKCELELFANCMCMYSCPFPPLHASCKGHASSTEDKSKGFFLDYYSFQCASARLKDPVEFVRGNFIRPEDVAYYNEIGMNIMKVSDRFKSSSWILNTAKAYASGQYDGNLSDIIAYPYMQAKKDRLITDPAKIMSKPGNVNIEVLKVLERLGASEDIVHIDNNKLKGFLEFFKRNKCEDLKCDTECTHCAAFTKKSVSIDHDKADQRKKDFALMFDMLGDGDGYKKNSMIETVGAHLTSALASKKNSFES